MKVAVGSDFSAVELKDKVKEYLSGRGYEIVDLGNDRVQEIYPEIAAKVARAVQEGMAQKGILFCGTGGGVSIVANKFKGVYCVASESIFTSYKMRQLNDANVMAMGKNVVGEMNAFEMAETFLKTDFCQDYGEERRNFVSGLKERMLEIERENMK